MTAPRSVVPNRAYLNQQFLRDYRQAFARRRSGELDVEFPYGTYKLAVQGLCRVAAAPALE